MLAVMEFLLRCWQIVGRKIHMAEVKLKMTLPATSLLVMSWVGMDFYRSKSASAVVKSLDMKAGDEIAERFKPIWAHFDQAMQNRKYAILQCIKRIAEDDTHRFQVINLGSGIDPLSLEIVEMHDTLTAFDVDYDAELLSCKSDLVSKLAADLSIEFIRADVANKEELRSALIDGGWNPNEVTVVVAEGLSYYLGRDDFWNSLQLFKSNEDNNNYLVFDFYKREENIDSEFGRIATESWGLVYEDVKLLTRYDRSAIESQLKQFEGELIDIYKLKRAEYERYGSNQIFTSEKSGWAEVCLCRI